MSNSGINYNGDKSGNTGITNVIHVATSPGCQKTYGWPLPSLAGGELIWEQEQERMLSPFLLIQISSTERDFYKSDPRMKNNPTKASTKQTLSHWCHYHCENRPLMSEVRHCRMIWLVTRSFTMYPITQFHRLYLPTDNTHRNFLKKEIHYK